MTALEYGHATGARAMRALVVAILLGLTACAGPVPAHRRNEGAKTTAGEVGSADSGPSGADDASDAGHAGAGTGATVTEDAAVGGDAELDFDASVLPFSDAMMPTEDAAQPDDAPLGSCPGRVPNASEPHATTHKIKDLTGTLSSSGGFGVGGTDLGIPVRQPNGQIAYVFGDTFEQDMEGGPGWRSPVLLRSAPGLDGSGIVFNGAAGGSYAKQLLSYDHNSTEYSTWLPSDVITIGDRMYLHYIVNKGLGNVRWTQIAYSDDNGENWTVSSARWEADENNSLQQLWTWERGCDGYVYIISTKFISRDQPIIMHRVPETALLDKSQYEPWGYANGSWGWGKPASVILTGQFGELSLRRVENKWVLSWFNAGDYDITIKVFDSPTSNLYEAKTFKPITGAMAAQLYGGYIHPDSTLANLHLIVSQWNTTDNWPYHATEWVTSVR